MHYLPRFCNFIDSIATFTVDVSVLGPLSVRDTSLRVKLLVRTKDVFQGSELTAGNFIYLNVGPPEEIHHHVRFESFQ